MADEQQEKRAPGRPRKPADARLEQTTFRLSPVTKRGLELIARLRRTSQNEAVSTAVAVALRHLEVGGKSLHDVTAELVGGWFEMSRADLAIELAVIARPLLDPMELYFVEVFFSISPIMDTIEAAVAAREYRHDADVREIVWESCRESYSSGLPHAEAKSQAIAALQQHGPSIYRWRT